VPTPAPSKSNGGAAGKAKIFLWSSVITQPLFGPTPPAGVTLIGSAIPSTQIDNLSFVVIVPPSTLQVGSSSPLVAQAIGLLFTVQSAASKPSSVLSNDWLLLNAAAAFPFQIPLPTAKPERW